MVHKEHNHCKASKVAMKRTEGSARERSLQGIQEDTNVKEGLKMGQTTPQAQTWFERCTATTSHPSKEHIRSEFKRLSMMLHPDKNLHNREKATELFKQIMEAYECLRDDLKRAQYDQQVGYAAPQPQTRFKRNTTFARHPKWP